MKDSKHQKSPTPEGKGLIDNQNKGTELVTIFTLFSDGKQKTVPELAKLTGFSNSVICEHLKTILSWRGIEHSGTKNCSATGVVLKSFRLRKGGKL